jgi:hypothetical protein
MVINTERARDLEQAADRRSFLAPTRTRPLTPERRRRRPGWCPPPLWTPDRKLWTPQNAIGTPTSLGTPVASAVTATTRTFTTGVTAPSNSLIVALCTWGASTAVTGTFSGGGLTWATDQTNSLNFGFVFSIGIFSAPAVSGLASSTVLTLTGASGIDANISVCYVTGMDLTGTRKDASNGQGATTDSWDSGSATTTNADDLLIGGSMVETLATSTPTVPQVELFDWQNSGDGWSSTVAYQIVAATGSQKVSGTWSVAGHSEVAGFVAYKAAAGGGGGGTVPELVMPPMR